MGYIVKKQKSAPGWRIIHRTDHGGGKVDERRVGPHGAEFAGLGLNVTLTIEQARAALARSRAEAALKRRLQSQRRHDERRATRAAIESAWLPLNLVEEFERDVIPEKGIREDRWLIAKELIAKLPVPPEQWYWKARTIYEIFKERADSLDYTRRLVRIMNLWGAFFCLKTGRPFLPLEAPEGPIKASLRVSYYKKKPDRSTRPLTTTILAEARQKLSKIAYNGLYAMFWAGLRPEELRQLREHPEAASHQDWKSERDWWIQEDDPRGFKVLHVFQWKLFRTGKFAPEQCWKAIPLVEIEQQALPSLIRGKEFAAPSKKTMKKHLGISLTARSARRGFADEMQLRGYGQDCYDRWLGHVGTSTLRRHYESKEIAYWKPPVKEWKPAG